jgi:hypothetical protein
MIGHVTDRSAPHGLNRRELSRAIARQASMSSSTSPPTPSTAAKTWPAWVPREIHRRAAALRLLLAPVLTRFWLRVLAAFGGVFWSPLSAFGASTAAGRRVAAFGRVGRLRVGGRVLGVIVVGLATLLGGFWP